MRIIKALSIEGFRSIQNSAVDDLSSLTAFVGANNTGKSNVLRALSLFFNGEPEPGSALDLTQDFFYRPKSKKKRRIVIEVEFEIPSFSYNPKVKDEIAKLGQRFRIRKSWTLDEVATLSAKTLPGGGWDPNLTDAAQMFLRHITFRYIPNRIIPSAALGRESKSIAEALVKQLSGKQSLAKLAEDLDSAIDKMTASLGRDIATATSTVQTVQANRSTQVVGRLLGYTGFAAITPMGAEVQEGNWGSGLQSFLMFLYLAIVDQSAFRQSFGWKQATLWAVEEPESSMHRDLAIRLAEKFRDWTGDDKYRLQILSTTHNDVFVMTATSGYFVRMNEGVTELAGRDIANLTRMASRQGITSWSHPLLSHPINAVVLVEGLTDAEVLAHAAAVCGVAHHVRFVALKDLDDDAGNGADQVAKYVREHRMLLTARPTDAPFMVLFDWDVADGPNSPLGKSRAAYLEPGSLPVERVIRMDEAQCNPLASSDIKGIERFYPSDVFEGLDPEGELQKFVADDGTFTFGANGLSQKLKARLRVRMLERTDEASFSFLRPTLEKIQALAKDAARSQASLDALLAGASEE